MNEKNITLYLLARKGEWLVSQLKEATSGYPHVFPVLRLWLSFYFVEFHKYEFFSLFDSAIQIPHHALFTVHFVNLFSGRMWWYMPVIPALVRQKQKDHCKFKTSLIHIMSSRPVRVTSRDCLKTCPHLQPYHAEHAWCHQSMSPTITSIRLSML